MNRDDIIRMAREAGGTEMEPYDYGERPDRFIMRHEVLERFAVLVTAAKDAEHQQTLALQQRSYEREIQLEVEAERERIGDQCAEQLKTAIEDEREACARVCEDYDDDRGTGETWGPRFADLIRARGNT